MKGKKILIVQNIARESLGLIEQVLDKRGCELDIVDVNEEDFPSPKNYGAVFVLGGPDSANDKTSKMLKELRKIKEILDAEIPYFGVCLGMQILVKAAGGEVYPNSVKEVGCKDDAGTYYEVYMTDKGNNDLIFEGIKSPFKIFHLHGETVRLSNGMELLGTGKHCKHQVIKIGKNAYGVQGHLEVTESMLNKWLEEDSMFDKYDKNAIMEDYKAAQKEYYTNGTRLINNFLNLVEMENKQDLMLV